MKNLKPKSLTLCLFVVFAVSYILAALISGKGVTDLWSAVIIAYKAVPIVVGVATLFVVRAWRWRIFHPWLVPFPDLNGTWQGKIQTTWRDPNTGQTPGPIPAILTIKQSFVRVSCVMRTSEMASRSFLADFWLDADEQIRRLGYSYISAPLPSVVHRSKPHYGTMVFEIIGNPANKLTGVYWTDRGTTGKVILTFRQRDLLEEMPDDLGPHPVSDRA
jgi:hypothetical protein